MFYVWYVIIAPVMSNFNHCLYRRTLLLGQGPWSNFSARSEFQAGFVRGSGLVVLGLLLYSLFWACLKGVNVPSTTSEVVRILDVLLGPVFVLYFVFELHSVDYDTFGL